MTNPNFQNPFLLVVPRVCVKKIFFEMRISLKLYEDFEKLREEY